MTSQSYLVSIPWYLTNMHGLYAVLHCSLRLEEGESWRKWQLLEGHFPGHDLGFSLLLYELVVHKQHSSNQNKHITVGENSKYSFFKHKNDAINILLHINTHKYAGRFKAVSTRYNPYLHASQPGSFGFPVCMLLCINWNDQERCVWAEEQGQEWP